MFELRITGSFKKDLKTLKKRSANDFELVRNFIKNLSETGFDGIDQKYKPHKLKGNYAMHSECHILPDLLLIWMEDKPAMTITLVRTGTHSDLF